MKRSGWITLALFVAHAATTSAQIDQEHRLAQLIANAQLKTMMVQPARGILHHPYLIPLGSYTELFEWDSYFAGLDLSYDDNAGPLLDSVKNFLDFTSSNFWQTGYTPREIAPDNYHALPDMCKPFLAQAALRASLTLNDFTWLAADAFFYYNKLKDSLQFWEEARRAPEGLYLWARGLESGVDNTPAIFNFTAGVDLQCYLYREYRAMATIALQLGNRLNDVNAFIAKAAQIRSLVRQYMWSEEDASFYNVNGFTGEQIRINVWTNFTPLYAQIATVDQAQKMIVRHVLNPDEFWAAYGIRSLARTEPAYTTAGYWRGPVWGLSNWMVMHGLLNYGFNSEAYELAVKTVDLLERDLRTSGGMNENYDPDTGAPLANSGFASWDLLGEHIIDDALSGYDPSSEGLATVPEPATPAQAAPARAVLY